MTRRPFAKLFIVLAFAFLFLAFAPKAEAYDLVYDPINWVQNLLKEIEETYQTTIQNTISGTATTISTINSTINQVTQYIYQIESLVQQAVGTVTSKIQLLEQLYGEVMSLPASFQNAYQSILNIPNQFQAAISGAGSWGVSAQFGGNSWGISNDPITRYLGGAVAALQSLTGLINQAGYDASAIGRFPAYNGPAFAANLSQALGAQALKTQNSASKTIINLQQQGKNASTQQAKQAVDNQTRIEAVAVQTRANQLSASEQLADGQRRTNEIKRYNTTVNGAETAAGNSFYNTFAP
jgi:phage-related protein